MDGWICILIQFIVCKFSIKKIISTSTLLNIITGRRWCLLRRIERVLNSWTCWSWLCWCRSSRHSCPYWVMCRWLKRNEMLIFYKTESSSVPLTLKTFLVKRVVVFVNWLRLFKSVSSSPKTLLSSMLNVFKTVVSVPLPSVNLSSSSFSTVWLSVGRLSAERKW